MFFDIPAPRFVALGDNKAVDLGLNAVFLSFLMLMSAFAVVFTVTFYLKLKGSESND